MTNRTLYFTFVAIALFCTTYTVRAAEFNPNFILSDEEMQHWQSMTRADIQAFLDEKGGYISSYVTEDWEGTLRPSSDIIYRAAVKNQINPKYILVKLQKEQSLIMHKNPTQRQLDWAAGYGVCDSCSPDDANIQRLKGFGKQVDSAAGIIRWYYDNVAKEGWIKRPQNTYIISNTAVTPANLATAFLYTYTPHIHGNLNFWKLWQLWFDQVYPDGTLIKTTDDPSVYIIENGKKRKFLTMSALATRHNPDLIITVPGSELSRYESGRDISLPNYAIVHDGNTYWLLDYNYKRPFAREDVVRQLGYHPDEIITVSTYDLDSYELGTTIDTGVSTVLGRIVQIVESKNLYYIDETNIRPIFDPAILKTNFSHLTLEKIPAATFNPTGMKIGLPIKIKDGVLFGITGFNEIYVVEKGKKRHIASEEVFNGLGYSWKNIVWVNEYVGMAHETGEPLYLKTISNDTGTNLDETVSVTAE